jgi:hypothetical protein
MTFCFRLSLMGKMRRRGFYKNLRTVFRYPAYLMTVENHADTRSMVLLLRG